MRPAISPVLDIQNQKNFASIREALGGNLSFDNMNIQVISGTTANTPDTQYLAIHSMTPRPVGWFPLVGDVYVQEISNRYIDVRSTKPGVNFKIVLLGGPPVTGESLVAVGNSTYTPTATPSIFDSSSGSVIYGDFSYILGPSVAGYINHIVGDSTHLYWTQAAQETNYLIRYNRTTNILSRLQLGALQLGPIYDDSTYLWVIERASGATLYKVNKASFSLSDTITLSYTSNILGQMNNVNDLYVDGTCAWIFGSNGPYTGSNGPRLNRNLISSGAEVGYVGVGTTYGHSHQLAQDDTYFYFTSYKSFNFTIHRVLKTLSTSVTSTGAVWSVQDSPSGGWYTQNCVSYNDYLYSVVIQNVSLGSTSGYPATAIVEYNKTNNSFSFYPIFLPYPDISQQFTNGAYPIEIKILGEYLFIRIAQTQGEQTLIIFNLSTKEVVNYIYPFYYISPTSSIYSTNRHLLITSNGDLLLTRTNTNVNPGDTNMVFIIPRF